MKNKYIFIRPCLDKRKDKFMASNGGMDELVGCILCLITIDQHGTALAGKDMYRTWVWSKGSYVLIEDEETFNFYKKYAKMVVAASNMPLYE